MSLVFPLFVTALLALGGCSDPELRRFGEPAKTGWAPEGVRPASAAIDDPVLPERSRFSTFHGDTLNSDEVEIAFAPMFEHGWVAEPQFYVPEGPTFDSDGNLYFIPSQPREDVLLLSVGLDGKRRWALPGARPGMGGAPLVLNHPESPGEERIYAGSYESMLALSTAGEVLWDEPTGLRAEGLSTLMAHNWGVSYHAASDGVLALLGDGTLVAHRRLDGLRLIDPYRLPGSPAANPEPVRTLVIRILAQIARALGSDPVADLTDPNKGDPNEILDALMGAGSVVSNFFSIDPNSGRIWIVSTAPDADDGRADGESALGALYALEMRASGERWSVAEHCRYLFEGGSSSTPALRADGSRIYIGDDVGRLLAIDSDCNEIWRIDVGEKLMASISVASDNDELYGITGTTVKKVVDRGDHATLEWNATLGIFDGAETGNLSTAGIGANGVMVHVGAGRISNGTVFPRKVGLALLDRETGKPRYAAEGIQESIAAMTTNVDGGVYLAHSPVRVLFTLGGAGRSGGKLIGGIGQYRPIRSDLLARDALCAAAARAENALRHPDMPDGSRRAERRQIDVLIAQAQAALRRASTTPGAEPPDLAELRSLLSNTSAAGESGGFEAAAQSLAGACATFD